jgi:hypothetical protein
VVEPGGFGAQPFQLGSLVFAEVLVRGFSGLGYFGGGFPGRGYFGRGFAALGCRPRLTADS